MVINNIKIYLIIAVIFAVIVSGVYIVIGLQKPKLTACTMDAKICPDGSSVGRTEPNCEFAACPTEKKSSSGIKGTVLLGPMCPVVKDPPDPQCDDRPYKTKLVAINNKTQKATKEFDSTDDGKFNINLPVGEYVINSAKTANMFSRCSSNGPIKVVKNKYTRVTINCDTGIR